MNVAQNKLFEEKLVIDLVERTAKVSTFGTYDARELKNKEISY